MHKDSEDRIEIKNLEEKLAATEAKVLKLEHEINKIKMKFEATESNEASKQATIPSLNENANVKETVEFKCKLCEFKSHRNNGLTVHVGRKHQNIDQLDGNTSLDILNYENDNLYENTKDYWINGYIGRTYQTFIDAIQMVEESTLDEAEKKIEKEEILNARKEAFGDDFRFYAPWK